jgi:hypothetical protein
MLSRYHVEITHHVLGNAFAPSSLKEVVRANVGQHTLPSLFGAEGYRRVCDCTVACSLAYIIPKHLK